MNAEAPSPLDILLRYQRNWVDDDKRFKIGLMARQTGKSFVSSFEAVMDCSDRKTQWVCLSAGERQALEWMLKAREHTKAFEVATEGYHEERDGADGLLKMAEIRWSNGSRLLAIPANPDTARGYSANLLLDEFAFHENPDAIWRAIYPSISNPLKEKFKIRIVSTPAAPRVSPINSPGRGTTSSTPSISKRPPDTTPQPRRSITFISPRPSCSRA